MPKERSQKDIKFKDSKEFRDVPWEERPGGNILSRILKSLMRTIKYVFDPEYRYTVKLMDQYAVKSAFYHEKNTKEKTSNYKKEEKSFDKEHSNDKKKEKTVEKENSNDKKKEKTVEKENSFNKEIESKEIVLDEQKKNQEKNQEKILDKANDVQTVTPENALEIFKKKNPRGLNFKCDKTIVNVSLDNILRYFKENNIVYDDPQKYVSAAVNYGFREKEYIHAYDMFNRMYKDGYYIDSKKDPELSFGCKLERLHEYFLKNNLKGKTLEEYEGYAEQCVSACMKEKESIVEEFEHDAVSKKSDEPIKGESIEEKDSEKIVQFEADTNKDFVADAYDEMDL